GELAGMNNVLLPAGIIVNLLIWNREADLIRLGICSTIIFASLLYSNICVKV
ncbi:EamA family transporter, partial [Pseudoalteromonas piscicida]